MRSWARVCVGLTSVSYTGPRAYSISRTERETALSFESMLDSYTNDSSRASC
jgi:hypothetical protein